MYVDVFQDGDRITNLTNTNRDSNEFISTGTLSFQQVLVDYRQLILKLATLVVVGELDNRIQLTDQGCYITERTYGHLQNFTYDKLQLKVDYGSARLLMSLTIQ